MPTALTRRAWFRRAGAATLAATLAPSALAAPSGYRPTSNRLAESGLARLSSNENPFGPSPAARAAMQAAFDSGCRYPFESAMELIELIAARENVTPEHVLLGCGSTEILHMAGLVFGLEGGEVLTADPTYGGLTRFAQTVGAHVHGVPLDPETLAYDLDAMDRRMTNAVRLVYICNPNNPTGTAVAPDALLGFCERASKRAAVFVDEAYYELMEPDVQRSAIKLVRAGHDVIVARTFSKIYGLAGLRIGYALAPPHLAERLRTVRMAGPNVLGLAAAAASLEDDDFYQMSRTKVREARQQTYAMLDALGRRYVPSQGNFVFFHTGRDIRDFQAAMRARGVLVARPFPPYLDWCRVSMGTDENMAALMSALQAELG